MSLLSRIAPNLMESFKLPFERRDANADWTEVQKGGETPEMHFMHNTKETFGKEDPNPQKTHALSQKISRVRAKLQARNARKATQGIVQSGNSSADIPQNKHKYVIRTKPSGLEHSHDAIERSSEQEKEIQRRIDRARSDIARRPGGLSNSQSRDAE